MTESSSWVDLASERVGGRATYANDEFFAEKENLLKEGRGVFIEDKYTDRGKWMDGWETRRRREPGHDWCVIRLGLPGAIHGLVVDTNHFRGNNPEACSIEACSVDEGAPDDPEALAGGWVEILPRSILEGHAEHTFDVESVGRYTHVRLNIFPDGGVARLRVLGEVLPDWERISATDGPIDLVAIQNGGTALACSDQFYSDPTNLTMSGRSENMGDGWETKRRRGPGHDWAVLRLGHRGLIEQIEVDTNHFKGNYPESCSLEGCDLSGEAAATDWEAADLPWVEILPRTPLEGHKQHRFGQEIASGGPFTHVRLNMYPDGGISRLRLLGRLDG